MAFRVVVETYLRWSSGISESRRSLEEWRIAAFEYDSRLYVMEAGSIEMDHKEWEHSVRGGSTLWERAVRKRRMRVQEV